MTDSRDRVSVRYMVDDVQSAIAFYTKLLDFEVLTRRAQARESHSDGRELWC